jgi:DNA/RNA endonuclease YhcR with UshA esterase domain
MKWMVACLTMMGVISSAVSLVAHHSFAAEYDINKPLRLAGTVTKVEWTNPHGRVYIDVKDEKGEVTNWNFELGSPLQLRRQGWRQDSLKIGDQVTVEGYHARDGSKMANARRVTMADGRAVFAGSADDNPAR